MKQKVSKHRIITLPASSLDKPFIYKGKYGWFVKAANNPLLPENKLRKKNMQAWNYRDWLISERSTWINSVVKY